jgi:hypothetical protein
MSNRVIGLIACIHGVAACGSVRGGSPAAEDAGTVDGAAIDAVVDAAPCFGGGVVRVCVASPPAQPLTIAAPTTIDTGQALACATVTSDGYCVIAATEVMISSTLRATGPRPLVLVASGSITVTTTGILDVGSHRNATPELGAGADFSGCDAGVLPVTATTAGGGAGGSFAGAGGNGGTGWNGTGTGGTAGLAVSAVDRLRGGCPGQKGAVSTMSHQPTPDAGARGHGGGAVYLIAGSRIDVQGAINAAGEGGGATPSSNAACGGGGGGSGGMIGLDAPMITNTGLILASGGGGGGGASDGNAVGTAGADPTATTAATGGHGGAGTGGPGGTGSARTSAATSGADGGIEASVSIGAGGGGGGGAGLIRAPAAASLGSNLSPVPAP